MIYLAQVLALLILFLVPLSGTSPNLGFEETKVFLFIILVSILGLVWLCLLSKKEVSLVKSRVVLLVTVWIIILALTSLAGTDPLRSFLGRQPYLQGFILYFFLYFYFLIISTLKIPLKQWVWVISVGATLVSLSAILQAVQLYVLHQNIPTYAGRVVSTFGQPNLYAGFLLIALPFVLTTKYRIFLLPLIIVATLVSQSRIAIFLAGLFLAYRLIGQFSHKKSIMIGVLAVAIAAVFFSYQQNTGLIWSEVVYPQQNLWLKYNSPEKRVLIWPIFLELIKARPVLGYGLENIPPAFSNYFQQMDFNRVIDPTYYSLRDLNIDRSHNLVLDLLMFSGLLGLITWCMLFKTSFKLAKGSAKTSLVILVVWMLFQPPGVVQLLYLWLILGLINQ